MTVAVGSFGPLCPRTPSAGGTGTVRRHPVRSGVLTDHPSGRVPPCTSSTPPIVQRRRRQLHPLGRWPPPAPLAGSSRSSFPDISEFLWGESWF